MIGELPNKIVIIIIPGERQVEGKGAMIRLISKTIRMPSVNISIDHTN